MESSLSEKSGGGLAGHQLCQPAARARHHLLSLKENSLKKKKKKGVREAVADFRTVVSYIYTSLPNDPVKYSLVGPHTISFIILSIFF